MVFNFQRVFADEVSGEFFNRGPRAFGLALKGGLAPADDAGVGGHFDQAHPPAGIELFDLGDFHGGSPVWAMSRVLSRTVANGQTGFRIARRCRAMRFGLANWRDNRRFDAQKQRLRNGARRKDTR